MPKNTDIPSHYILYHGADQPLPQMIPLRAGPLSLLYDNGDLRYIRIGEHEILRRIYVAVRDHNWGTIPAALYDVAIEARVDSFTIHYVAHHQQGVIDFSWAAVIEGAPDGTIRFSFDGEAHSTFQRNRIGFCVLHPMDCAGVSCTVEQADGRLADGKFPELIAPHQPFFNMTAITHDVLPGLQAEVRFEGDVFEMEDQRNWTDASYKTYCTPLGLPFPVTVQAGDHIRQAVTLRLVGAVPELAADKAALTITFGKRVHALPPIGLALASHGESLTDKEIQRLRALKPGHLRVELRLNEPDMEIWLRRAAGEGQALQMRLEMALFVTDEAETELTLLRKLLDDIQPAVSHFIVHHQGEKSTQAAWTRLAREILGDYNGGTAIGGGTAAFFAELNRERPPASGMDFVVYSINPQVHAFENADLTETLAAGGATVETALDFSGGKSIFVTPVTLKMRFNPNATGPEPETLPGELPPQVDARQMSLYGAGWTLGSIKYLAESGAARLTYYETTGWLGVMERETGSPLPEQFPSLAGGVFPLYHVLADLAEFAGGDIVQARSTEPLAVDALLLNRDTSWLLLANFTAERQRVSLPDVRGAIHVRFLDETTVIEAMRDPEGWRGQAGTPVMAGDDGLTIDLLPYAVARLDWADREEGL